jgi:hypothetical protein
VYINTEPKPALYDTLQEAADSISRDLLANGAKVFIHDNKAVNRCWCWSKVELSDYLNGIEITAISDEQRMKEFSK